MAKPAGNAPEAAPPQETALVEFAHPLTGEVRLATPDNHVLVFCSEARALFDAARTLAEVMHAVNLARMARRVADMVKASNVARGAALGLEVEGKIRVAEEYEAAQAAGKADAPGGDRKSIIPHGAGDDQPATLKEIGLDSRRLSEWRTLARRGIRFCLQLIDEILAEDREPTYAEVLRGGNVGQNALKAFSGNNEYYTPARYIEAARAVLGEIDLDPASCDAAQETVKAKRYFTKEDDGLSKSWKGRVWMNPPYAAGLIDRFVAKLVDEYEQGGVTAAIVLVDNRTDTAWFHQLADACTRVCFTRGRVNFYNETAKSSSPANGSALFYFGDDEGAFDRVFARIGFGGPVTFTQSAEDMGARFAYPIPDLDVAKDGSRCWVEVKVKAEPTLHRKTNTLEHGIGLRLYQAYQHVQAIIDAPVWLVVFEQDSHLLLGQTANKVLAASIGPDVLQDVRARLERLIATVEPELLRLRGMLEVDAGELPLPPVPEVQPDTDGLPPAPPALWDSEDDWTEATLRLAADKARSGREP